MSLCGGCDVDTYSIHQIEPLMMLMKGNVKRVMALRQDNWVNVMLEWEDGRTASILCTGADETPFTANILTDSGCDHVQVKSKFFEGFIANLVEFFRTGVAPVSHEETISIMAVREMILNAVEQPGIWVNME